RGKSVVPSEEHNNLRPPPVRGPHRRDEMPLLPLEPYLYPENLLQTVPADEQGEARWWVLHTRPRAEKALARQCIAQSLAFFLPVYPKRWRSGGRLLPSPPPLFPRYVFLDGDLQDPPPARQTNLLASV